MFLNLLLYVSKFYTFYIGFLEYYVNMKVGKPHPKRLKLCADKDCQTLAKHPLHICGSHARPYTVPIAEKIVEHTEADHEPTPGYRAYRTAKTAVN